MLKGLNLHPSILNASRLHNTMYHTLDICEQVAEKLSDCQRVADVIANQSILFQNDLTNTLAHGLPGLSFFYSILDRYFPDKNYDSIAHEYLRLATANIPNNITISFFHGLSGLCFAANNCSRNGQRYTKLLSNLESLLIERLNTYFNSMHKDEGYNRNPFNLSNGICGPLIYLLTRSNGEAQLQFYKTRCLESIIESVNRKVVINGHAIPGWYESQTYTPVFFANAYNNGGFSIDMFNGVAGVLTVLSLAACEGISVPGLHEAIFSLAEWLKSKKRESIHGPIWPSYVSFEEEIGEKGSPLDIFEDNWNMSSPTILRALFLAAKAIGSSSLKSFALENFVQYLSSENRIHRQGASFSSGKAGLLASVCSMVKDTNSAILLKTANQLESEVKNCYNPDHPFGFQASEQLKDVWLEDPSLMGGASGVVLSLLLTQQSDDEIWSRIFLLN